MSVQTIDAKMLQKMFLAGAKGLEAKKEYINELNVFPVSPSGTGTNMTMTIMAAAKEVANLQNPTLTELGKAISSGSLRGARGNSGVIMSQIFRGFVKELKGLDIIDVTALGNGVQHAAETAYKAVMKPKEGTILTVAKAGADKSMDLLVNGDTDDIIKFCDEVAAEMEGALLQTPELLPVLPFCRFCIIMSSVCFFAVERLETSRCPPSVSMPQKAALLCAKENAHAHRA